jgi:hypothetical protein
LTKVFLAKAIRKVTLAFTDKTEFKKLPLYTFMHASDIDAQPCLHHET